MELKEGIVLQVSPYRDNSKLLKILSNSGLETYLVKGSGQLTSKNFSYTRELSLISFSYVSRGNNRFPLLTTGNLLDNFSVIKDTQKARLEYALYIIEFSLNLAEHVENSELYYNFTKNVLVLLNTTESISLETLSYYPVIHMLKCTYLLGIAPSFKACVHCGSHNNLMGFSLELGGVTCVHCSQINDNYIDNDIYQILSFLYSTKLEFLTFETLSSLPKRAMECFEIVQKYYERYLDYKSKVYLTYQRLKSSQK